MELDGYLVYISQTLNIFRSRDFPQIILKHLRWRLLLMSRLEAHTPGAELKYKRYPEQEFLASSSQAQFQ